MVVCSDPEAKAVALAMLKRGLVTASEAARLAGVSRQLVRAWCRTAGIDAGAARARAIEAEWLRYHGWRLKRLRKMALRRMAMEAKAEFDLRVAKATFNVPPF